jgi:hypothetical protein
VFEVEEDPVSGFHEEGNGWISWDTTQRIPLKINRTFRRNMQPSSSPLKNKPRKKQTWSN